MSAHLHLGNCLETLRAMPDNSVDAVVTDPPYGLSFMGKRWDYDVPSTEVWAECLRVLKPGGHLLAFAGTRTQHRMAVRIEDAGFEIRDMIAWVYGSGFPKSLDVSKAIDKAAPRAGMFDAFATHFAEQLKASGKTQKEVAALFPSKTGGTTGCVWNWAHGANVPTVAQWGILQPLLGLAEKWLPLIERVEAEREVVGQQRGNLLAVAPGQDNDRSAATIDITAPATDAARQWQGWGTALKPALEPITVARKPLIGTVAENVLAHGTGAINVDGCRVNPGEVVPGGGRSFGACEGVNEGWKRPSHAEYEWKPAHNLGRWPANLIHDCSDEVLAGFPDSNGSGSARMLKRGQRQDGEGWAMADKPGVLRDAGTGSAARFFYCAKASKSDRGAGNVHPTVKPTDLMRYLCRLVTPPGGVVLDPFMGSGSTGKAAMLEGFRFIGCELSPEYMEIARARIAAARTEPSQGSLLEAA